MEDAVHHLPLVGGLVTLAALLEDGHEVLPLLLARERGEALHGTVPLEVQGGLDDHEETVTEEVDLHLEDADTADTLKDLCPHLTLGMAVDVLADERVVGLEVHGAAIALHGHLIGLGRITCCHSKKDIYNEWLLSLTLLTAAATIA